MFNLVEQFNEIAFTFNGTIAFMTRALPQRSMGITMNGVNCLFLTLINNVCSSFGNLSSINKFHHHNKKRNRESKILLRLDLYYALEIHMKLLLNFNSAFSGARWEFTHLTTFISMAL